MKFAFAVLAASTSVLAMATPAIAQETATPQADTGSNEGAPIIVTARRRDEDVQDIPLVVNAVSAADIADLNLRQFEDVESLVPGLDLRASPNGIGGNASIRGVNFDVNASGSNPTVEFYQNDAPISAGHVLQQMYDIGQIEVLRGPQGTLRGRASPSGSITITTRKPDLYDVGGFVSSTANDIGTLNFTAAVGAPIIEGVLGVRVAGIYNEDEGDRVRTTRNTLDGRDPFVETQGLRVSALLEPTDWLRFEGVYSRLDKEGRTYNQVESANIANPALAAGPLLITAEDRLSISETPRVVDQRFDVYNWRAEAGFAGQRLIYVGNYNRQLIDSFVTDDNAEVFSNFDYGQTNDSRSYFESHEVRLQNEEMLFGLFDYVIGYFKQDSNTPTDLIRQTPIARPPVPTGGILTTANTVVQRIATTTEESFFGNLTLHIGDSTEISGGLRYIDLQAVSQLIVGGRLTVDQPTADDKLIYNASINHFFTPDLMVYASTGTSFRAGPTAIGDFSVQKSALQQSFTSLPPEESTSYEVGVKSTWLDGRLRFNVSGYYQEFQNYPYRSPGGVFYQNFTLANGAVTPSVGIFNFIAAVPVEVYGVEAEIGFDITDDWNLNAVASYSHGEITDGTIPCNDLNGDGMPDVLTGAPTLAQLQAAYGADNVGACGVTQRSAFQAPFSATVQSEYALPISDSVDGFGRFLFSYQGNSQNDPTNRVDDIDAYGLLNLYAGVRDPGGAWELQLYAKNVFDTLRVISRADSPGTSTYQMLTGGTPATRSVTTSGDYRLINTTAPQEFGLSFRYAFGSR